MPPGQFPTGSDEKVLSHYCSFVNTYQFFFIGHFKSDAVWEKCWYVVNRSCDVCQVKCNKTEG